MDYQTFNLSIDDTLTYEEQKKIIDKEFEILLPAVVPKLKRECVNEADELIKKEQEKERERQAEEIRLRFVVSFYHISFSGKFIPFTSNF